MMRALLFGTVSLVTVDLLVLGTPSADAATCAASALTTAHLPTGTFETYAYPNGTSATGTLDGNFSAYYECTAGGTLISSSSGLSPPAAGNQNAVIPFYGSLTAAGSATISVATTLVETGDTFDIILNGASVDSSLADGGHIQVNLLAGLNKLGIVETYGTPYFGGDLLTVSVTNFNYIPEPATLALLGFGAACLVELRRRKPRYA
jgi:PEP-CTERM motif